MRSRRAALIGFAAALLIGLAGLAAAAIATTSNQVQTLGVGPVYPVAPLHPHGGMACEQAISLAEPLTNVRFNVGTFGLPGPRLDVTVRPWGRSGAPLGSGHVARGWEDIGTAQVVPIGHIPAGDYVEVCIRNRGYVWAYVYGDLGIGSLPNPTVGPRPTATPAYATVDGQRLNGDLSMSFVSKKERSLLSRVPDVFRRASLFRPGFVGPWVYWLLFAGVLLGAPLLIGLALRRSVAEDPPEERDDEGPDPAGNGRGAAALTPTDVREGVAATRGSRD